MEGNDIDLDVPILILNYFRTSISGERMTIMTSFHLVWYLAQI